SPDPPPADPATGVRGYTVAGGQVVLDIGTDSAEFVSATPTPGWTMQVWTREESGGAWIRVTFTQGDRSSSVFCSWNGYPPRVDIDER
ncbi:Secreted protein, partial [Streptomyces sp. PVA_94-07]